MPNKTLFTPTATPAIDPTLICIHCNTGHLVPEPLDDMLNTPEHFVCHSCQHHDTIPTNITTVCQVASGLIGLAICSYLLWKDIDFDQPSTAGYLIFILGFSFVILQAIKGLRLRRNYISRSNAVRNKHTQTRTVPKQCS